jgi:hypothetical protein
MRKVLLTTTALVAFSGVSAALALDISGNYSFDYVINDNGTANTGGNNNTSMASDMNIDFTHSQTTDAGLSFSVLVRLDESGSIQDQKAGVSGDFGKIEVGASDGIVDGMDAFYAGSDLPHTGAGTTNSTVNTGSGVADTPTANKISYQTPVISGFQAGVTHQDAGRTSKADINSYAITYDFGVAKIGYAASTTGAAAGTSAETDMKNYGIASTFGDFGIRFSNGTDTTKNTASEETSKIDTTDWGISYGGIENVSLYFNGVSSEEKTGTNAGDKLDATIVGLGYTVAPGITAKLESGNNDFTDATAGNTNGDQSNYTFMSLSVDF